MCRPTRPQFRGRLKRLGEMSEDDAQPLHRGTGGGAYMKESARNTGSPGAWSGMTNRTPARDRLGAHGVAERLVVPLKPGNSGGGKGPQFKTDARRSEGPGRLGDLSTPDSVQKLQTALHAKAKAESGYRFYALYDKISREDILAHAYAQRRSNKGVA